VRQVTRNVGGEFGKAITSGTAARRRAASRRLRPAGDEGSKRSEGLLPRKVGLLFVAGRRRPGHDRSSMVVWLTTMLIGLDATGGSCSGRCSTPGARRLTPSQTDS